MRFSQKLLITILGVLVHAAPSGYAAQSGLPLEHVTDIALPAPAARFDYLSFDVARRRLFVANMGADRVLAIDVETGKTHIISDMPDVHGVLAVPSLGRVYATVTARNQIVAIDIDTFKTIASAPTGRYPDGIAFVPHPQTLYVSDKLGHSDTVIAGPTHRRIDTIELGGEVGNTQYDLVSKHVFVNVASTRELVEIDPETHKVIARDRLEGARGNHGLYIEPDQHLAFIACEDNNRLIVFDLDTRKQTGAYPVGADPDVLAFDQKLRTLYVASESGVVSMFREQGKQLVKIGEDRLAPAAHSVAVNPLTHEVYFPLPDIGGRPVLRVMRPLHVTQ
jgi:DNA-binding beta-propeller fold protein YncE